MLIVLFVFIDGWFTCSYNSCFILFVFCAFNCCFVFFVLIGALCLVTVSGGLLIYLVWVFVFVYVCLLVWLVGLLLFGNYCDLGLTRGCFIALFACLGVGLVNSIVLVFAVISCLGV